MLQAAFYSFLYGFGACCMLMHSAQLAGQHRRQYLPSLQCHGTRCLTLHVRSDINSKGWHRKCKALLGYMKKRAETR